MFSSTNFPSSEVEALKIVGEAGCGSIRVSSTSDRAIPSLLPQRTTVPSIEPEGAWAAIVNPKSNVIVASFIAGLRRAGIGSGGCRRAAHKLRVSGIRAEREALLAGDNCLGHLGSEAPLDPACEETHAIPRAGNG